MARSDGRNEPRWGGGDVENRGEARRLTLDGPVRVGDRGRNRPPRLQDPPPVEVILQSAAVVPLLLRPLRPLGARRARGGVPGLRTGESCAAARRVLHALLLALAGQRAHRRPARGTRGERRRLSHQHQKLDQQQATEKAAYQRPTEHGRHGHGPWRLYGPPRRSVGGRGGSCLDAQGSSNSARGRPRRWNRPTSAEAPMPSR